MTTLSVPNTPQQQLVDDLAESFWLTGVTRQDDGSFTADCPFCQQTTALRVSANPNVGQPPVKQVMCRCTRGQVDEAIEHGGYDGQRRHEIAMIRRQEENRAEAKRQVAAANELDGPRFMLRDVSDIAPKRVKWTWDRRVPVGEITLIAGKEGIAKSTISVGLGAKVTRGTLEGEFFGRPRDVVIVATEDDFGYTIVPRLMAAGADLTRVLRVDMREEYTAIELPVDLELLERECAGRDVALIILDPLTSRLSSKLDTHKDSEVRRGLEPLKELAGRLGAAILGIIHINKTGTTDPLDSIMASKAFTAVPRSILYAIIDPDDDAGRNHLLGHVKSNLGPTQSTKSYTVREVHVADTDDGEVRAPQVVWGDDVERSIREVMETAPGEQSKRELAAEWIRDWLCEHGQVPAGDVLAAGTKAGHGRRTMQNARSKAGAISEPIGMPRVMYWRLASVQPGEPCPGAQRVPVH